MKLLADTHVVLWYFMGDRKIDAAHRKLIERAERKQQRVFVSVVSLWEIAKLSQLGRIKTAGAIEPFIEAIERHACFEVVGMNGKIAVESTKLGDAFPKDPFDQIIVATARVLAASLLTSDQRIIESHSVRCLDHA
jgi:PIN domain nuclease of toxin-antitoxin system